ncbi:hypothetical protein LCGC14_0044230 [marine sediment metagenome]|jgi:hypothetical protein|uniref:Uncharacterized protein n=2 Tax=root TaxID=1 RepID=A0A7V1FP29_9RHOB|nr:hypothetical protein [Sulfitobacter litoralis]HDZ53476.1 hypothetical protein [Sulfitobacter litoralis]
MPEHYTALIEDLMIDVQRADSIESSFSKIGLAGLIEAREAQVFKEFEGRGRPNPNLLNAADDVWLRSILSHQDKAIRLRMAMCLGLGAEGTPLEAAMQRLEASPDPDVMVDEMRYGYNEGMRRRLSLKPEPGPKGEEDESASVKARIRKCGTEIVDLMLKDAVLDLDRKAFLRHINTLILLEEAALLCGSQASFEAKELRKLAIDYALMRLLSGFDRLGSAGVDEITSVMRLTGRAARLSNPVSDALDRVQKYAAQISKDPDALDAARAAGRPLPANPSDLKAAARQCRLFRDRERA